MATLKNLKEQFKLPALTPLKELLKVAERPIPGSSSETLPDADTELLCLAVPYWQQTKNYAQAIKQARLELAKRLSFQAESNGNGHAKSTTELQLEQLSQKAAAAAEMAAVARDRMGMEAVSSSAHQAAVKDESLFWVLRGALRATEQVQNDPIVEKSREFYYGVTTQQSNNSLWIDQLENDLEQDTFFQMQSVKDYEGYLPDRADDSNSNKSPEHQAAGEKEEE